MVTKEQIVKEMTTQLDFYASEYKEHQKFKEVDLIINCFEQDALTYNVLMMRLFKVRPTFSTNIDYYISKREKEGWK